eukprot:CAMPEP_0201589790 /NCGR_PEP_ID=MMETSP0190_2-20130828/170827_1 /ASSEMBLY_ACC=CAM_ASM_000263 /TAXON_ID=37353 /ORGANISM="Rosalina sp." /LENGTH=83 /DNA_ID=CAMNT_0048044675 /DNA_START=19 /DNA_END=267 /DNA_ORIENTATION=+
MASAEQLQMINHLPGFYQSLLIEIAPIAALPLDQLNMIMMLFLQAIAGSVYRRIKDTMIRQIFGMILGCFIMYSMYGLRESVG